MENQTDYQEKNRCRNLLVLFSAYYSVLPLIRDRENKYKRNYTNHNIPRGFSLLAGLEQEHKGYTGVQRTAIEPHRENSVLRNERILGFYYLITERNINEMIKEFTGQNLPILNPLINATPLLQPRNDKKVSFTSSTER